MATINVGDLVTLDPKMLFPTQKMLYMYMSYNDLLLGEGLDEADADGPQSSVFCNEVLVVLEKRPEAVYGSGAIRVMGQSSTSGWLFATFTKKLG